MMLSISCREFVERMTTQLNVPADETGISEETELSVRNFVRTAMSRLSELLNGIAPDWNRLAQWELGSDGNFRERATRIRNLFPVLTDEWLRAQPEFAAAAERMKSDPVVGRHFGCAVGTPLAFGQMCPERILHSMIYAVQDSEGNLGFDDERFDLKWRTLVADFSATQISFKTIGILPNLSLPAFPLRLSAELVLDRLAADEVTQCEQAGVVRPRVKSCPVIFATDAVGVRREALVPKVFGTSDEGHKIVTETDEGSFGHRPLLRYDLVVDDVLSAMRLFKRTTVRAAGHASWADSNWFGSGTHYQVLRQSPFFGDFALSDCEVPQFLELWSLLEHEAARFGFTLHRFSLSFDRGLLADRIVDLVIAAESLFLKDQDENRGELSYRCALRAAKFVKHHKYSERDVFQMVRLAY